MSNISDLSVPAIRALAARIEETIKGCACLEHAAQKHTDAIYEEFTESVVLARLFATVPFGELPPGNQKFVTGLAASAGIASLLTDQTLVLSLLGTRGANAAWNDRRNSLGHVGIPLASGDFVEAIPMMSRLLKELGLGLEWIDHRDTRIVSNIMGRIGGVFYVLDAKTAVDQRGRKIIAAQDFVSAYDVKTVFGLGGGYLTTNTFITSIVFAREQLNERHAKRFIPLMNAFKSGTMKLAAAKKIFAPDGTAKTG